MFDLDGVLAKYDGWIDGLIGRPLELGIKLANRLDQEGFKVIVQTTRTCYGDSKTNKEQAQAVKRWLNSYLPCATLCESKGKAYGDVYFDDRSIHIPSNWSQERSNQEYFAVALVIAKNSVNQEEES